MMKQTAVVLPLENGDMLTRAEFQRRYHAMPQLKKAELIDGRVYVGSPVSVFHAEPHAVMVIWAGSYAVATPGLTVSDNGSLRLEEDSEVQPDVALRSKLGRCRQTEDGYLEGPPEFVVEVASSSASYDLHDKLRLYERVGVQEYVVWRVRDGALDWFELEDGCYQRREPDRDGVHKSRRFPGLWLDVPALLGGIPARVMERLQEGIRGRSTDA
jgi:Uma2 family endonuclease